MEIATIWILFGVGAAICAGAKRRSVVGWFILGVLLGPFGLLFVLLSPSLAPVVILSAAPPAPESPAPPLTRPLSPSELLDQETKVCPFCAETIKFAAKKCRLCGSLLDADQVERELAARRALLEEEASRWAAGQKKCAHCGRWEVIQAFLPDGSFGDWCPLCKKPAQPTP